MKKAAIYALLITIFYNCGSNDRGELVGIKVKKKWFSEKPFGMALIPGGSFTMGKQDEDISGTFNTPTKTVTVRPYYMDVTEVTNNEYKSFVHWVRDSIVRTRLGYQAEFAATGASPGANGEMPTGGIQDYKFKDTLENSTPYQKYMYDNYYSLDTIKPLDWSEELIWDQQEYPDVDYVEVMDSLYINKKEAVDGIVSFNTKFLKYRYSWFDRDNAARKGGDRKDFVQTEVLNIYPDTTVWVKDFNYSYNDPMHQDYFYHQSYGEYPVVGFFLPFK